MQIKIEIDTSAITESVEKLFSTEPSLFHSFDESSFSKLISLPNALSFSNSKPTLGAEGINIVTIKVEFSRELKALIIALGVS
jgi:hypothetical protein